MGDRLELEADGRTVSLSSPDKELVVGVTKAALAAHWQLVGPLTVAAVGGRPVSAKRAPDGPDGESFFQKQQPKGMPRWVETVGIPRERDGGTVRHVVLVDTAHLLALTQFGTVEVHVTTWSIDDPWRPRELLLDLDPPPDAPVDHVRSALADTTALLDELALPWRVKTTGSKGFHVHVPVTGVDQELARDTAGLLARALVDRHGDRLTTEFAKEDRDGRVLVDWWRNGGGATAIVPWSPRVAPGGPVAMPLRPAEMLEVTPDQWHVADVPARLDDVGDPWEDPPAAAGPRTLRDAVASLLA